MFTLPIPGAEDSGPSILALRNLQRAKTYGLPSGQAVADYIKKNSYPDRDIPVLSDETIGLNSRLGAALGDTSYNNEIPLWLYILAEADILNHGARLGPVGSRIVAEVIGGLLAADGKSYVNQGWTPDGGNFTAVDLLREAGVLPSTP